MNIAILFNSDDEKYGGSYGASINRTVFQAGPIQSSDRHMKVSVGDVLIYSNIRTWSEYDELTERVYFADTWSLLLEERLRATFRKATVYALTFENMTKELAAQIHAALIADSSYLGLMEVDFAYGPHLSLFRNSMITKYRVEGEICRLFFSMSEEDEKDDCALAEMNSLGFTDVDWEDRGAHGTIFDDFDTLEHFRQVAAFRDTLAPYLSNGVNDVSELAMVLEDLNPQLFNVLGSATSALKSAQHEEDVAQVALSGRRYLEKLADVLFPARDADYKGRKVGREHYRNRIWAFIGDNVSGDQKRLDALGSEVDRLADEFNAGLHSDMDKERVLKALVDVSSLTAGLLALNPVDVRKPYYAHQKRIVELLRQVIRPTEE